MEASRRTSWRNQPRQGQGRAYPGRGTSGCCEPASPTRALGDGSKMSARRLFPKPSAVTYQEKLGSYSEKVERIREPARWLSEQWFASGIPRRASSRGSRRELSGARSRHRDGPGVYRAAGHRRRLYAKSQGEPEEVAWAVYDHHKPAGLKIRFLETSPGKPWPSRTN